MSFIGLVTRKEKDTGATLIAKIVTPSKKRSTKKAFKVKVKANALDDYSCCVIDHATVKNRLENAQDLTQMVEDLVFNYNGVNGTTINYEINNKSNSYPKLTDYLGEDGKLLGRPKYTPGGSGNAEGTITIIVSKGNEEVRSNIQVAIKGITSDEVFTESGLTKQKIWQIICGANSNNYSDTYHVGGNNNITAPLSLVSEVRYDNISSVPIKLTYTITDDLIPFIPTNGEFETDKNAFKDESGNVITSRIDSTTGKIFMMSFAPAAYLSNNTTLQGCKIDETAMLSSRRVRLAGIHIAVNMTLEGSSAPRTLMLDCSVMSKYLTNNDIYTRVIEKNLKYLLNGARMDFSENNIVALTQPATTGEDGKSICELTFMSHDICTTFDCVDLGINAGDIRSGISFSYKISDMSDQAYDATAGATAFDNYNDFVGNTTDESGFYIPLVVNYNNMKTLAIDKHEFCIHCDIQVSGYSVNGENNLGSPTHVSKLAKFKVAFAS